MAKEDLLRAAKAVLEEARRINPLNTDHSANLARMFRQSGDVSQDAGTKRGRYEESSRNYAIATSLSPQNVQLLNEWATLYLQLGDRAKAWEKLEQSVAIDKKFDQTYLLRGDFLMQEANVMEQQRQQLANQLRTVPATDTVQTAALNQQIAKLADDYRAKLLVAIPEFEKAVEFNERNSQAINVLVFLNQQIGEPAAAIVYAEKAVKLNANDWNAWQNVAVLSKDLEDLARAKEAGERALALAPANNKPGLQAFLEGIKQ
jgi:tetratricopeptide (TPR) repeat protein